MREKLIHVGCGILVIAFFVTIALLIGLLIHGGAWLSAKLYPILKAIFGLTLVIALFVLIPIAIFKKTRLLAGNGMVISSFVFGLTLWVWSFLLTYSLWGGLGIFIGLFLFGVGIVPIAMLATLVNGMWSILGQLMLLAILTFGSRFFGIFLTESIRRTEMLQDNVYKVEDYKITDDDFK